MSGPSHGHASPAELILTFIDCALQYLDLILSPRTGKKPPVNKDPVQLRVALPAANPPDHPANKPFSRPVTSRA
jgi:hypothetical protein